MGGVATEGSWLACDHCGEIVRSPDGYEVVEKMFRHRQEHDSELRIQPADYRLLTSGVSGFIGSRSARA